MKKLVLIIDKYPLNIGGMETHAYEFIKFFKRRNWIKLVSVIGFSSGTRAKTIKNKKEFDVPVTIFPEAEIYNGDALIKKLKKNNIGKGDVIFLNSIYWIRVFPKIRSCFKEAKIILRSGGNDLVQAQIEGAGKKLKTRQVFVANTINQSVDFLIVNSAYSYNRSKKLGVAQKIMRIATGGVDTNRFAPKSDKIKSAYRRILGLPDVTTILTVCRFVPFKNVALTLQSVHKMKNRSAAHILIGDGPEIYTIQKTIDKLGIRNKVILIGSVPLEKIHFYFWVSDIYCQTPIDIPTKVRGGSYIHTETMGRSFCEALSSGIPVVATGAGGIKEVVLDKKTGFLAQRGTAKDIAKYLDILTNDAKLREKVGMAGRKHAIKNLSWNNLFKNYLKLFTI